jgi:hypothetical protein
LNHLNPASLYVGLLLHLLHIHEVKHYDMRSKQ